MSKEDDSTPWGEVGYITYKRTYSRKLKDGKSEEFVDTVDRIVKACDKQLKVGFTESENKELKNILLKLKGSVAGRFMWQLGTKTVDTLGLLSLQNCAFTVVDEPIRPFTWAMDCLMLGSGVGFNIQREYVYEIPKVYNKKIKITRNDSNDADFIIPDSREGWVMLLERTLQSYFFTGESFSFSTKCIRGYGTPIKGFGGTASGPEPLCEGILNICGVLNNRKGKKVRPIDCLDIMNIIGSIVVAGNVRRSAQIALGDMDDLQFLSAKRWDTGLIPNWRALSNNSVICNDISKLPEQFWEGYKGNGEPYGLINLNNARRMGRTGETEYKDLDVAGFNPCVTGDTEVLTESGYSRIDSLLDQPVKIWNGFEFSEVQPRITGYDQEMLDIKFSNGTSLKCTKGHKFVLSTDYNGGEDRIDAVNLRIGDKLIKHNYPIIETGTSYFDMYTQGFYSGDGVINKNLIWLYEPKFSLEEHMNVTQIGKEYINKVGVKRKGFKMNFKPHDKKFIPNDGDLNSKLSWLAGLLDSDGTELIEGGSQICSVDYDFLLGVQKLLSMCGENSKIVKGNEAGNRLLPDQNGGSKEYMCKETNRICISAVSMQNLKKLGLPTKRLKFDKTPNRDASRFVQVTSITEIDNEAVVYCFTEPNRNLGCFNGVVTGQCAEQSLAPYETCCLAEVHLQNIDSEDELKKVVTYLYRINKHSLSLSCHHEETEEIVNTNMRMGIGITGVCMSQNKLKWLDNVYKYLREYDKSYSKLHGFPESIKITTVKPSGTLSLLSGATPGAHPGYSIYHIRRIRMSADSELVNVCRKNGYSIEYVRKFDGTDDRTTVVVSFPCKFPKGTMVASETDAIGQLEMIKKLQEIWSDNAVSVTIYYKMEELEIIKDWLSKNYNTSIKSVSFLLHNEHGFDQAPLEEITEEEYNLMISNVTPITQVEVNESDISEDQIGCAGGACPIK